MVCFGVLEAGKPGHHHQILPYLQVKTRPLHPPVQVITLKLIAAAVCYQDGSKAAADAAMKKDEDGTRGEGVAADTNSTAACGSGSDGGSTPRQQAGQGVAEGGAQQGEAALHHKAQQHHHHRRHPPGQRGASAYIRAKQLQELPSPLEFLSYVFAAGNLLAGPFFECKDYLDFIARRVRLAVAQSVRSSFLPSLVLFLSLSARTNLELRRLRLAGGSRHVLPFRPSPSMLPSPIFPFFRLQSSSVDYLDLTELRRVNLALMPPLMRMHCSSTGTHAYPECPLSAPSPMLQGDWDAQDPSKRPPLGLLPGLARLFKGLVFMGLWARLYPLYGPHLMESSAWATFPLWKRWVLL